MLNLQTLEQNYPTLSDPELQEVDGGECYFSLVEEELSRTPSQLGVPIMVISQQREVANINKINLPTWFECFDIPKFHHP